MKVTVDVTPKVCGKEWMPRIGDPCLYRHLGEDILCIKTDISLGNTGALVDVSTGLTYVGNSGQILPYFGSVTITSEED